MQSPFATHRDMVLGHYSTASWLRHVVLAMWNGNDYPVGLSKLATLDDNHASAVLAMIQSYRKHGEGDPAFMALAKECIARVEEEQAAAERSKRWEDWCEDAQFEVKKAGGRAWYVDDHYNWFERQFNSGMAAEAAAALALSSNLDIPQ